MATEIPLADLIRRRQAELQLSEFELVQRMGYQNVSKGLNRLRRIYEGDLRQATLLIDRIAQGLQVTPASVSAAVEQSTEELGRAEIEREQRCFKPHAVFLTENRVPRQIAIAAVIGADRERYLYFDENVEATDYLAVVMAQMPSSIPLFGRVEGAVINYTLDHAVRLDRSGSILEVLDHPWRLGQLKVRI